MSNPYMYQEDDFPNGLNTGRFGSEVFESSLGVLYRSATETPKPTGLGFRLRVRFSRDLDAGEVAQLDALVAAHDPSVPLPPGRLWAQLSAMQPGVRAGMLVWCRDATKEGETPGAGTGTLVVSDGSVWRRVSDDSPA